HIYLRVESSGPHFQHVGSVRNREREDSALLDVDGHLLRAAFAFGRVALRTLALRALENQDRILNRRSGGVRDRARSGNKIVWLARGDGRSEQNQRTNQV